MDKTLLVVDDEPDVLLVLSTALQRKGFRIIEASNGEEALSNIESQTPDAIVMDIMMPKLDGYSVSEKLRANPSTAHIPVILMTGKGNLKELLNIREKVDVAAYIEKPFKVATLVEYLEKIWNS